jgi:methylated-DNA-[protein]-cysteine S-methyltransferase
MSEHYYDRIDSPLGPVLIAGDEQALTRVEFSDALPPRNGARLTQRPGFGGFAQKLEAYFAGDHSALDDIEVRPQGTPFQQAVWRELRNIPTGRTISYGELARRLGKPSASRAVGLANSKNPIAVVVPCHRVIGADGRLTGYAGGLERKLWLLQHEGSMI